MMEKITIITPVFNGASTIQGCLQSLDRQTFRNIEHIIIDAASTDATLSIIQGFAAPFRTVLSEKDNGIYDGMNKGLVLATGDIVGILNADDMYADDMVLQDICDAFSSQGVASVYGDLEYVDFFDISKVIRSWKSGNFHPGKFRWGWMPPHPTFYVHRSVYEQFGLFNLDLGSAADYELMLRFLLKHEIKAAYIPKVLVKMRTGGASNATLRNRLLANRMDRKAWDVNRLKPYPWTLWLKPVRKVGQWFVKGI